VTISSSPPGRVDPAALSVPICTSASSEGCSCSAIVAVIETSRLPDDPDLAVACRLIVPVKELAPLVVFEASCTASSGLDGVPLLAAAVPELVAAQPAKAAAAIAVTPAA